MIFLAVQISCLYSTLQAINWIIDSAIIGAMSDKTCCQNLEVDETLFFIGAILCSIAFISFPF
jgi:hypothetical protein